MMELLDLPMEIFYYDLLRYFRWNDLLRFRRVCSTLTGYTDAFIRGGRRLPPIEIEISDDKPISDFLKIDFPIHRIYFRNYPTPAKLFENYSEVSAFLDKFGPTITHLRFHNLSVHLFLNENRQFLEGLFNLESLEFDKVGPATSVDGNKALTLKQIDTLKNLKSLKIEASLPVACIYDLMLITTLKKQCGTQLEYLSLPRIATFWERDTGDLLQTVEQSNKPTALKYFDFGTFSEKGTYGNLCLDADIRWSQFPEICNALVAANVKLLNVPAGYFENYYLMNNNPDVWEVESQEKVGKAVVSLVNLHLAVNDLEMPNLKKITFTSPKRTSIFSRYNATRRPLWPRLRELDITIDSKRLAPTGLFPATITYTEALFHFLFVGICRPSVEQLCMRYSEAEDLPVPKSEYLISACPNIKQLVLVNWQGTNKSLARLWGGLPLLEDIHLERCTSLGNAAFFGEDVENPVFMKLKKLNSLTLKGLEHMPMVSDTLFRLVIRLLKLKQLTLEGGQETPLKNITISGIRSLLSGPFAQSIEKFSLKDVNLEYVGKDEMRKLERQFRSYNML